MEQHSNSMDMAGIELPKQEEEDEVVEQDPDGRYYRYNEIVGRGRFKTIYKAFDTQIGIDVAWSKLRSDTNHLSQEQLKAVLTDMRKGLELEHPNIIKCFKCWESEDHSINLITELFTSGNLRQYRHLHKHLDLKAVKRMARQILKGLDYIHRKDEPLVHGDLRCDKIYVNGHSGEIKIGDLGLTTLLPKRWALNPSASGSAWGESALSEANSSEAEQCRSDAGLRDANGAVKPTSSSDIFAFGLCMLELLTIKQLDSQHCNHWRERLVEVSDEEARSFISHCVGPAELRPSAADLLEDPFLMAKKTPPPELRQQDSDATASATPPDGAASTDSAAAGGDDGSGAAGPLGVRHDDKAPSRPLGQPGAKLRGEDWCFELYGTISHEKLHFHLVMTESNEAGSSEPSVNPIKRTLTFVFDPEVDTVDNVAAEISEEFKLSPTDLEICAAALREWMAQNRVPGAEKQ